MSDVLEQNLDHLGAALAEERRAILEHDVPALIEATQRKLDTLRRIELCMRGPAPAGLEARLVELSQGNQANGTLLARRRREVNWALRQLGRSETSCAYDARGQTAVVAGGRPLGVV